MKSDVKLKKKDINSTLKLEKIFYDIHLAAIKNMMTAKQAFLNMMSHIQESENDN